MTDQILIDKEARFWLDKIPYNVFEVIEIDMKLTELLLLGHPSQEILDEIFTRHIPPYGSTYAVAIAKHGVSPEVLNKAIKEFLRESVRVRDRKDIHSSAKVAMSKACVKTAEKPAKLRPGREELTDEERKEARDE